jgi:hypothetical protein
MVRAPHARLELEAHENLSRTLLVMAQQAHGIRGTLRQATGGRSRVSLAAVSLVEAIGHLQECLSAALETEYGAEAPAMTRTRYLSKG